ncbi:MAG TPA: hypothetical protein VGN76_05310 [Gemmatimonadales bacterium]|jgi:hypothetical protein|nr:hypothetical protein [Gemmatimonadales bacterium]
MRRLAAGLASLVFFALAATACSDAGPSNSGQVSLNFATQAGPAAARGTALGVVSTPETFTDGTNTLVISRVELVVREIELHRVGVTEDCASGVGGDCEELELGPLLVDMPLGTPGATRSFSVELAPGSYDKLELKIHTPSASSDDAAFLQQHPDLVGTSVRVTGTYNNGPVFTYTANLEAEMEFELNPPVTASETGATDLTLFVNLDGWFRDAGNALINPETASPGQSNESLVQQNIQSSLRAFEDEDHDARDDHGTDHP